MVIKFVDKAAPVLEPVIKYFLFFLVKLYLEPVLYYTSSRD